MSTVPTSPRRTAPCATQADAELMTLQPLAHAVGGWTISYPYVVQPLMAAATVGEGKLNLKEAVVQLYQEQIAASLLPGGWIIIEELNLAELEMLDEWLFLDELEELAVREPPLKGGALRYAPARRQGLRGRGGQDRPDPRGADGPAAL